jgi:hypothetical protein
MKLLRGCTFAGLALFGLFLSLSPLTLPRATAQRSARGVTFVFEEGNRVIQNMGRGRWQEIIGGRPARYFDEMRLTPDYVELYTGNPQPTWVRIYSDHVVWRTEGDPTWRLGRSGWWERD